MTDDIKLKEKRLSPVSIVLISLVVFVFSVIAVGGAFVLHTNRIQIRVIRGH